MILIIENDVQEIRHDYRRNLSEDSNPEGVTHPTLRLSFLVLTEIAWCESYDHFPRICNLCACADDEDFFSWSTHPDHHF
jgi:hypothetical protein